MDLAEIEHVNGCPGCLGAQLRCGHSMYCSRDRHRCANQYTDVMFWGLIYFGLLVVLLVNKGFI